MNVYYSCVESVHFANVYALIYEVHLLTAYTITVACIINNV